MRDTLWLLVFTASLGCASPQPGAQSPDVGPDPGLDGSSDLGASGNDLGLDSIPASSSDVVPEVFGDLSLDRADGALGDGPSGGDTPELGAEVPVADVLIDPGMCGSGVRRCLCACAGDGVCNNACIARDIDCGGCLYNAASRCCPDLSRVFEGCIDMNMCADDVCVTLRCGAEQRAFDSCFAALQMTDEGCRREVRTCLGPDYPMIQCVRP